MSESLKGKSPFNKGIKLSRQERDKMRINSKLGKKIIAIELTSGFILEFESIKHASEELYMSRKTILNSLKNKLKEKRYKFLYKEII